MITVEAVVEAVGGAVGGGAEKMRMRSVQAELNRSGMALSTLLAVLVGVWVEVVEDFWQNQEKWVTLILLGIEHTQFRKFLCGN